MWRLETKGKNPDPNIHVADLHMDAEQNSFLKFNTFCGRLVEFQQNFEYLPGDEAVVESSFEVDLHSDLLFLDVQLRVILLALFLRYLNLRVAENKT